MLRAAECKHAKSVRVVALVERSTARVVGKIIGHYSDNPAGSVCTATLYQFGYDAQTARAGGYGYDKFSDALAGLVWVDQLGRSNKLPYGDRRVFFDALGINYEEVL